MDPDLAMAIGAVLGVLSVPSLVSAMSEGRPPRVGALVLVTAAGLVIWAISVKPGGYAPIEVPALIVEAVARFLP
ncbi:hypothetical protein [Roseovarius autotrophicus]|uniref:hypothetical protein n=1 Tax=Roseovarius autotrophicus TaxID=2824121 RepID=UPI0019F5F26B|nr:hypothetical protein [Roseovarius autotrophicus]MBE0454559.1 hypothetical protein [Roseovarius sp.]